MHFSLYPLFELDAVRVHSWWQDGPGWPMSAMHAGEGGCGGATAAAACSSGGQHAGARSVVQTAHRAAGTHRRRAVRRFGWRCRLGTVHHVLSGLWCVSFVTGKHPISQRLRTSELAHLNWAPAAAGANQPLHPAGMFPGPLVCVLANTALSSTCADDGLVVVRCQLIVKNEKGLHVRPDQADIWLVWNAEAERPGRRRAEPSPLHSMCIASHVELYWVAVVMAGGVGRVEQHDAG